MSLKVLLLFGLTAVAISVVSAGVAEPTAAPGASAQSWAIHISIPGSATVSTSTVAAPPAGRASLTNGFSYPTNGSVITTGATTASASTTVGANAGASGEADISTVSIFGGEITASAVTARAIAKTSGSQANGDFSGTGVTGLQALGQTATVGQLSLGDWGYLSIGEEGIDTSAPAGAQGWNGFVTELAVHLNAPHGGLPAGSEIQIGYSRVQVQTAPSTPSKTTTTATTTPQPTTPVPTTTTPLPTLPVVTATTPTVTTPTPTTTTTATTTATTTTTPGKKGPTGAKGPAAPVVIPTAQPPLTAGPYVFPVYGQSSYTDTFGAPRSDVSYHHGDDIFGQLGQPLLAVAEGIVFSVGWNKVGGNRLWLRDDQGNLFYYAHLSAFAVQVTNGALVKAGDVVGFMGATGDADGTPVHLHFEVHPVSLLNLGYDGAVNPTAYLDSWKRVQLLAVPITAGWAPAPPGASAGPEPGAFLLGSSDISSADGLDPGSLERALIPPPAASPTKHP